MATPTYDLIDSTVLSSTASSVTFSSITQDYRDLVLVVQWYASTNVTLRARVNGDTSGSYYAARMTGNGTSTDSGTWNGGTYLQIANTGNNSSVYTAGQLIVTEFLDYSSTDKHKPYLNRLTHETKTEARAGRWANTSAITSIEVYPSSGSIDAGSTFYLYGIAS